MLIAHFYPNPFLAKFEKHVYGHQFLSNHCTNDANLIYCGSISQLDKAVKAKEQFGKPLICWVWDIPYNWRKWCRTGAEKNVHKWRDAYVAKCVINLRKCDKIVSASKWTQKVLKEQFNIESEQIYFYIDTKEFDQVPEQENKGYVIQMSRYATNKRFDLTIRAMQGIDRKLILIGWGDSKPFSQLAASLGIDADIYTNLGRSEVIKLLKQSEILVSPSVFEGWGMTPIEALYCKKAVLLNDLEVFREVYGDHVMYHKEDSVADMNKKLNVLLFGPHKGLLQWAIINGCKSIISKFTIPKFVERWNEIIK